MNLRTGKMPRICRRMLTVEGMPCSCRFPFRGLSVDAGLLRHQALAGVSRVCDLHRWQRAQRTSCFINKHSSDYGAMYGSATLLRPFTSIPSPPLVVSIKPASYLSQAPRAPCEKHYAACKCPNQRWRQGAAKPLARRWLSVNAAAVGRIRSKYCY